MSADMQVPDGDRDVEMVSLAAVRARQDARRINRPVPHQATMAMRDVDFLLGKVDELSSTLTACAALAPQPAQSGDGVAEAEKVRAAWEDWLFRTNWPFDWTTPPDNLPPTTAERMGRLWNERDNWQLDEETAADCIAEESGIARTTTEETNE